MMAKQDILCGVAPDVPPVPVAAVVAVHLCHFSEGLQQTLNISLIVLKKVYGAVGKRTLWNSLAAYAANDLCGGS